MRRFVSVFAAVLLVGGIVGFAPQAEAKTSLRPVITGLSSHTGPTAAGAVITVHGRNFEGARDVRYDGLNFRPRVISSTTVRVRIFGFYYNQTHHLQIFAEHGISALSSHDLYSIVDPPRITSVSPNYGHAYEVSAGGGTELTLSGREIRAVRGVVFGSTRGSIVRQEPNAVVVRAPRHAVGYTVLTLYTAYGRGQVAVRYVAPPIVDSIGPLAEPAGGGDTMTIVGQGLVGPLSVTVGGVRAKVTYQDDYWSSGQDFAEVVLPPHAVGEAAVRVTNFAGAAHLSQPAEVNYLAPGKHTWNQGPRLDTPGAGRFQAVSCVSADFCVAVSTSDDYLFDGQSWSTAQPLPGVTSAAAVSCTSPTYCVAVGSGSAVFDGTSWTAVDVRSSDLVAVQCPSVGSCVALGFGSKGVHETAILRDGAWSFSTATPDAAFHLSCLTADSCYAVSSGSVWHWSGETWSSSAIPGAGTSDLADVDCMSVDFCAATDRTGYEWTFHSSSGWTRIALPSLSNVNPETVSCRAPDDCVVGASGGEAVAVRGSTVGPLLQFETPEYGDFDESAVTCIAAGTCLAASDLGQVAEFDGTTWSTPEDVAVPEGTPTSVACTSATWCMASDQMGNSYTYDGRTWSAPSRISSAPRWAYNVTCASPSLCVAVPQATDERRTGSIAVYTATGWTEAPTVLPGIVAATCTARWCIAVSLETYATFDADTGVWSTPQAIGTPGVTGVSCVSSNDCEAALDGTRTIHFDGAAWSTVRTIPDPTPWSAYNLQIACSASGTCVAVADASLAALRASNGTWGAFKAINAYGPISCGTDGSCVRGSEQSVANFVGGEWTTNYPVTRDAPSSYLTPDDVVGLGVVGRGFALAILRGGSTLFSSL